MCHLCGIDKRLFTDNSSSLSKIFCSLRDYVSCSVHLLHRSFKSGTTCSSSGVSSIHRRYDGDRFDKKTLNRESCILETARHTQAGGEITHRHQTDRFDDDVSCNLEVAPFVCGEILQRLLWPDNYQIDGEGVRNVGVLNRFLKTPDGR